MLKFISLFLSRYASLSLLEEVELKQVLLCFHFDKYVLGVRPDTFSPFSPKVELTNYKFAPPHLQLLCLASNKNV